MFSEQLLSYRERARITKSELAKRIAVSLTYIASLESGRQKPPPPDTCQRIAKALELNDTEARDFLELSIMERVKPADLDIIRHRLAAPIVVPQAAPAPSLRRVPLLNWAQANIPVTEHDIPIGLELIPVETAPDDTTFALRIRDNALAPEFQPDDIVVIKPCPAPRDNDHVLVTDREAKEPLLRRFRNYQGTRVLQAADPAFEDILLDAQNRYRLTGKVVERVRRSKQY